MVSMVGEGDTMAMTVAIMAGVVVVFAVITFAVMMGEWKRLWSYLITFKLTHNSSRIVIGDGSSGCNSDYAQKAKQVHDGWRVEGR